MRIAIHTHDLGPTKNLRYLAFEAISRGHRVCFVGNDELGEKNLFAPKPDALVTAISSFKNQEELGERAKELEIPWVVFHDTFFLGRPASRGKVSNATAIVADELEIEGAREFGYGDAVYLGGPPHWQAFPCLKLISVERRAGEKIILVGGIKNAKITDVMLTRTAEAMKKIGLPWRLIFRPHPNEDESKDTVRRRKILADVTLIELPKKIDIINILGAADLSIHTSGATATIVAAYLRLPVVYYEDESVRQRMEIQTGRPDWPPVVKGAVARTSEDNMPEVISEFFIPEYIDRLKEQQEKAFPILSPTKKPEIQIMDFIEELVNM